MDSALAITAHDLAQAARLHELDFMTSRGLLMLTLLHGDLHSALPKDLTKITGLRKSSVSQLVDTLARDGMVERTHPIRDRRSVKIYLTEKGKEGAKLALNTLRNFCEETQ